MQRTNEKLVAVIGATGQQGGAVVAALQADNQFRVRALGRNPGKHRELAEEVVEADLNPPETLKAAFEGARGVFLVSNFWEEGADELKQASAAVRAAKDAGVKHFVWSTLPDVEAISGGKFHVPHFTGKAKVDQIVKEAGFANHTFVIAPFYYQGLVSVLAPHQQADRSLGWAVPLDPDVRCIHIGDSTELGHIVAGAFAHPEQAGNGERLPLVGDFMSFNEIIDTLNRQGHNYSLKQAPKEVFAWGRRSLRDVQLLPSAHLPGFGLVRPNSARKPNSRPVAEQFFDVGSTECPGRDTLNASAPVELCSLGNFTKSLKPRVSVV
jgi:uncharacterized protein YbjT (DUF2867 family)